MPDFEVYEQPLRREADERTGDVIYFRIPPSNQFVPLKAYVIKDAGALSATGPTDPLNAVTRVKIRKELLANVTREVRFKAAKLPDGLAQVYQPSGVPGDPDPGYWTMDIQKATA